MTFEEKVYNSIPTGKDNAIHAIEIQKRCGLTAREIRKTVEILRRKGMCICSGSRGYYLPETEEELKEYINTVKKTAKSTLFTLKTAKRALKVMQSSDQLEIPGVYEGELDGC